jgi:tetratricopeptide (TPR) repeat protein
LGKYTKGVSVCQAKSENFLFANFSLDIRGVICKNTPTNQSSEVTLAENYEGLPPEIEKLSERLAKDPKSLVFSSLANAYRKHNMVDEAIEILQKGLEIHPNYASARIVLGKCYADKRMYELAKEQFQKALEGDPQNVVVLENLANVYKTLNQHTEAFDLYRRLLDLDPLNEKFEKEVEELKGLAKSITDDAGQYDTFQTIPGQVAEEEKPEATPAEPEPESDAPTLDDVFKGAPDKEDEPPQQETTTGEAAEPETSEQIVEKPNIITTAADFSDMFEPKQPDETPPEEPRPPVIEQAHEEAPADEKTVETSMSREEPPEEEASVEMPQQQHIIHGPPTMDTVQQEEPPQPSFEEIMEEPEQPAPETAPERDTTTAAETQIESPPRPPEEEGTDIGSITSAFDDAGLDTASEPTVHEPKDSLAADAETVASEFSDGLTLEEQPTPEPPQEQPSPSVEDTIIEAQPVPREPEETQPSETPPPATEQPPSQEQPAATETLAEIYLSQGFHDKALQIYRELLAKDPGNESLKQKIASLEQHMSAPAEQTPEPASDESPQETQEKEPSDQERRTQSKNLDNFQDWLKKFQK